MNISFIAMQTTPQDLAEALDLSLLTETAQMPNGGNWVAQQAATGWSIFATIDPRIADRLVAENLPNIQSDCLVAQVNDTVMWSRTELFRAGQSQWFVEHLGEDGDSRHLVEHGALPVHLAEIKDRNFVAQDKEDADEALVDFGFEIPIELWESFTGFRYDVLPAEGDFSGFFPVSLPKKTGVIGGLLNRLMGRGG